MNDELFFAKNWGREWRRERGLFLKLRTLKSENLRNDYIIFNFQLSVFNYRNLFCHDISVIVLNIDEINPGFIIGNVDFYFFGIHFYFFNQHS